jgi:hypothetical protein
MSLSMHSLRRENMTTSSRKTHGTSAESSVGALATQRTLPACMASLVSVVQGASRSKLEAENPNRAISTLVPIPYSKEMSHRCATHARKPSGTWRVAVSSSDLKTVFEEALLFAS